MVLLPKPRQAVAKDLLPAEIDSQIRNDLGPYIVPSTITIALCLPN